jgi:hypothetical protein
MPAPLTVAIDAGTQAEAPRRRRAETAATHAAPFAQHVAAFYPYPNPQQTLTGGPARADGVERGPAPAGKTAAPAKRRNGRGQG